MPNWNGGGGGGGGGLNGLNMKDMLIYFRDKLDSIFNSDDPVVLLGEGGGGVFQPK